MTHEDSEFHACGNARRKSLPPHGNSTTCDACWSYAAINTRLPASRQGWRQAWTGDCPPCLQTAPGGIRRLYAAPAYSSKTLFPFLVLFLFQLFVLLRFFLFFRRFFFFFHFFFSCFFIFFLQTIFFFFAFFIIVFLSLTFLLPFFFLFFLGRPSTTYAPTSIL